MTISTTFVACQTVSNSVVLAGKSNQPVKLAIAVRFDRTRLDVVMKHDNFIAARDLGRLTACDMMKLRQVMPDARTSYSTASLVSG